MAFVGCRRSSLVALGTLLLGLAASLARAQATPIPCAACVALLLDVSQAQDAAARAFDLSGRTLVVSPGTDGLDAAVREAARLHERGAASGVTVSRLPANLKTAPGALDLVIVDLTSQERIGEAVALAVKTTATRCRAIGIRSLAVRLRAEQMEAAASFGLAPYFDVLVTSGASQVEPRGEWTDLERWAVAPEDAALDPPTTLAMAAGSRAARTLVAVPGGRRDLLEAFVALTGWRGEEGKTFATGVEVSGTRTLSAEEIVARHQAADAAAREAVRSRVSIGRTVLTFEAPGFSAPFAVTARTTVYAGPEGTDIAQEDIRVNGLALATRGDEVPRLPLIEPERVTVPPLAIALTSAYTYRLEGRDVVRARPCYLVAFEPREAGGRFYSGRAWIDVRTFGLLRIEAVQAGLPGPVVSSREVHEFDAGAKDGVPVWLPLRSEYQQAYETAIFSTPIHRVVTFERHLLDPPDFQARHESALRSDAVMMRDTAQGYRYLRRGSSGRGEREAAGRHVVAGQVRRVRTVAGGVTFDPNISVPMVFAGLNYLDFDVLGTGGQVDAFFGGTYGRVAWSSGRLGETAWRLSGDAFGMALSYNDRSFRGGVEQYRENVTQRPFHVAAGLVGPVLARTRLRLSYEMDYTAYGRSDSTAASFVAPASTPVHGVRLGLERQQGPWTFAGSWNRGWRQHWTPWGWAGQLQPRRSIFDRFAVRVARSLVWSPRLVGRVEASAMGGRHLDRFSRFALGTFEQPLRGYPSASIRFDRGVVARSAISWSAAPHLRLDAFADAAVAADPEVSGRLKRFPGIGAGIEAPLPFGLLAGVEWGYGFSGVNTDGTRGTQVVRVSVYKAF